MLYKKGAERASKLQPSKSTRGLRKHSQSEVCLLPTRPYLLILILSLVYTIHIGRHFIFVCPGYDNELCFFRNFYLVILNKVGEKAEEGTKGRSVIF